MSKVLSRRMFNGQRPTAKGTGITAYFDNGQMVPGFQEAGLVDFDKIAKDYPDLFKERDVPAAEPSDYDTVYNKISGVLSKGLAPARSFEELVAQRQKILGSEDEMGSARNNALMQLGGRIASTPGGLGVGLGAGLQDYSAVMSKAEAEQRAAQRAIGASALDALEKQEAERRGVTSKAAEYALTVSEAAKKAERDNIIAANEDVKKAKLGFIQKAYEIKLEDLKNMNSENRKAAQDVVTRAAAMQDTIQLKALEKKANPETYVTPDGNEIQAYIDFNTTKLMNAETGKEAPAGSKKAEAYSGGTSTKTYVNPATNEEFTGIVVKGVLMYADGKTKAPAGSLELVPKPKITFSPQPITIFDEKAPNGVYVAPAMVGTDGVIYLDGKPVNPTTTDFVLGDNAIQVETQDNGTTIVTRTAGPNIGTSYVSQTTDAKGNVIKLNMPSYIPTSTYAYAKRMEKPPVPPELLTPEDKATFRNNLLNNDRTIRNIDLLVPKMVDESFTGPKSVLKKWSTTAAAFLPTEALRDKMSFYAGEKGALEWKLLGRNFIASRLLSDKAPVSEQEFIREEEWAKLPQMFLDNPQAAIARFQQIRISLVNDSSERMGILTGSEYYVVDKVPMGNNEEPFNLGEERTFNYLKDLEAAGVKGSYVVFYPLETAPDNIKSEYKATSGAYGVGYYPTLTFK